MLKNFGWMKITGAVLAAVAVMGCETHQSQSLPDGAFVAPAKSAAALQMPQANVQASPPLVSVVPPSPATQPANVAVVVPSLSATTQPASPTVFIPDSLYMTLGGVVAEVNGTPIYANKVLSLLKAELSAKAKEMDADTFREYARGELERQRDQLIADEAEFAAAEILLSDDDKKTAEMIATQDRQKLVTESNGSLELAKRKVEADGTPFDEAMQQEYRQIMHRMFYQRKIMPLIQVTPQDMRKFYDANFDKLFSERDQAQFRVIKIDPARIGGPDAVATAKKRIAEVRAKALAGEDFTTLASSENQDDYLKSRAGDPGGWMQRDSYRIDAVDKAVWALNAGDITPVIATENAFFIAKLEAKKMGRTRPFEDQTVQDEIYNRLFQQQFSILRDGVLYDLESEAVVRKDPALLDTALDMAMQQYAQWRGVQ